MEVEKWVETIQWLAEKCVEIERREEKEEEGEEEPCETEAYLVILSVWLWLLHNLCWLGWVIIRNTLQGGSIFVQNLHEL